MPWFSANPIGFHSSESAAPAGAVEITKQRKQELHDGELQGLIISADGEGYPILIEPTAQLRSNAELCVLVDAAADAARQAVAGDPLRAVEYDRARQEAEVFTAAGYQGAVPPMVAAWAINARSPQQAAADILREAGRYTTALVQLRALRLAAKEQIRATEEAEQAERIAGDAIAAIKAAVAGVGNNPGGG